MTDHMSNISNRVVNPGESLEGTEAMTLTRAEDGSDLRRLEMGTTGSCAAVPTHSADEVKEWNIFCQHGANILNQLYTRELGKIDSTASGGTGNEFVELLFQTFIQSGISKKVHSELKEAFDTINKHYNTVWPCWNDKPEAETSKVRLNASRSISYHISENDKGHTVLSMNCEPLQTEIHNNQKAAIDSSLDNRLEHWEYDRKLHENDYLEDLGTSGYFDGTLVDPDEQAIRHMRHIAYKVKIDNLKRVSTDRSSWSVAFMPHRAAGLSHSLASLQQRVKNIPSVSRRLTNEVLEQLMENPYEIKDRCFQEWANKPENLGLLKPLTDDEKLQVYTKNCDDFWYDFADKDFPNKVKPDLEPLLFDYFGREISDLIEERNEKNLNDVGSLSNLSVEIEIDPWKTSKTPEGKFHPGMTNYFTSSLNDDCITLRIFSKDRLFDYIEQPKPRSLFKFIDLNDEKYYKPDLKLP